MDNALPNQLVQGHAGGSTSPMLVRTTETLASPAMDVMNFLNEATRRHPAAVSLGAGRPADPLLQAARVPEWLERFVVYRSRKLSCPQEHVWRELGQYSDTNGIITDLIARYLVETEQIRVSDNAIMVTNGFQEALLIVLLGIMNRETDALIAEDPTYIGLSGGAALAGVPVETASGEGSLISRVKRAIRRVRAKGKTPRALYTIADFSNPTGHRLSLAERLELLDLAHQHHLLILEDSAYRAYCYADESLPALKSLDRHGSVVHLGSFSKTFMPGVRLGFLVADQRVAGASGETTLAEELSKVKSFTSVGTSPVTQAVVGGFLLEQNFRLTEWMRERMDLYRDRRDGLEALLQSTFGDDAELRPHVRWESPEGGFFTLLTVPFDFGKEELLRCADEYGVIACPVSFFSPSGGMRRRIRLAFSNVSQEQMASGVLRLGAFIRAKLREQAEA